MGLVRYIFRGKRIVLLKRVLLLPLLLFSFVTIAQPDDIYDPSRDALSDFKSALTSASVEQKNIFVIAGGNWCSYCHRFEKNLKDASLDEVLENDFVLIKVNYSEENYNEGFFSLFPDIHIFPHIMIVSANGELLESTPVPSTEDEFKRLLAKYTIEKSA